nr:hypothetical protein [Methanobrevibacter arboriphilus]
MKPDYTKIRTNRFIYKLLLKIQEGFYFDFEEYSIKYIEQSSLNQENNQIVVGKSNIINVGKTSSNMKVRCQFQIKILSKRVEYSEAFDNIEEMENTILAILLNHKELKYRNIKWEKDMNFTTEQYDYKMCIMTFTADDILDLKLDSQEINELEIDVDKNNLEVV